MSFQNLWRGHVETTQVEVKGVCLKCNAKEKQPS